MSIRAFLDSNERLVPVKIQKFFLIIKQRISDHFLSFRTKIRKFFRIFFGGFTALTRLERSLQLSFRSREVVKVYFE